MTNQPFRSALARTGTRHYAIRLSGPAARQQTWPRQLGRVLAALAVAFLGFAPVQAGELAGASGALVIVGGGNLPASVGDKFVALAGGREARLVVIPTASYLADTSTPLETFAEWKPPAVACVVRLHTRDRAVADDPAFVRPLAEATGVWLSGGDQSLLTAAYHGTRVEAQLRQLLARGGVIGGTSAGAAVLSAIMIEGGSSVAEVGEGFGLLPDLVVDTHFAQRHRLTRLQGVVAKRPACVGIDEETAVVVTSSGLTVLGNANVWVCKHGGNGSADVQLLHAGNQADLMALTLPRSAVTWLRLPAVKERTDAVSAARLLLP
jgi:cyanophycinase